MSVNRLELSNSMWNLILTLSKKDLKQRYHGKVLAVLWVALNPLLHMGVYTLVFSKMAKFHSEGVPYPLFNLAALTPWIFFSTSLQAVCLCLTANQNLITRLNFPRIAIPFAAVLSHSVHFAVSLLCVVGLLWLYQVPVGPGILVLPLLIFIQIFFTLGIGLFLSVLHVYCRDLGGALPFILYAWMLVSPVVYSVQMVPERLRGWYRLNPMSAMIENYRQIFVHGAFPDWRALLLLGVIASCIFVAGIIFFKNRERDLADLI